VQLIETAPVNRQAATTNRIFPAGFSPPSAWDGGFRNLQIGSPNTCKDVNFVSESFMLHAFRTGHLPDALTRRAHPPAQHG
jgi:hypothetical protein